MDALIEYSPSLLAGAWVTLKVALVSVLLALVTGLIGAACKLSGFLPLRLWTMLYTTVMRGVPDLVMMLLVFYGGQVLLNLVIDHFGWDFIEIDPFVAGVLTIGLIFGAYFTETFRGAILAIPRGQIEAGISCGMSKSLIFRHVIWPQMVRYALPGFTNNWLVQLKATALVSVIGLQDLTYNAFTAGRSTDKLFTFMFAAFVIYLILTAISDVGFRALERHYSRGMPRA